MMSGYGDSSSKALAFTVVAGLAAFVWFSGEGDDSRTRIASGVRSLAGGMRIAADRLDSVADLIDSPRDASYVNQEWEKVSAARSVS